MDVVNDFARLWFIHECVLHSGAGQSPYGGAGEEQPFRGYVSQSVQRVDNPTGQELVTDTVIRCGLDVGVLVGDQIDLPEPFLGRWEVTAISSHDGIPGVHPNHQKITLTQQSSTSNDGGGGGIYG